MTARITRRRHRSGFHEGFEAAAGEVVGTVAISAVPRTTCIDGGMTPCSAPGISA
jgi:hypothetical protein